LDQADKPFLLCYWQVHQKGDATDCCPLLNMYYLWLKTDLNKWSTFLHNHSVLFVVWNYDACLSRARP